MTNSGRMTNVAAARAADPPANRLQAPHSGQIRHALVIHHPSFVIRSPTSASKWRSPFQSYGPPRLSPPAQKIR